MTEYPRKGDRVKVTYEGVVTRADDALHRFFEIDGVSVPARGGVVEITSPAVKPGTVAVRSGCTYVQRADGKVQGFYTEGGDEMTVLSGPVSIWGKIIYEPQD